MGGLVLASVLVAAACTTEPAATTTIVAVSSTTSTSTTTSTVPETTSTTSMEQRIAEVTEIVREVDFGWFDAIYRKDEAALLDVVAVQERYDRGVELMGEAGYFVGSPTIQTVIIELTEILVDREDCVAVAYFGDSSAFRGPGAAGNVEAVFWPRPSDGKWRRAYLGDEWQAACDDFLRETQLP
jgi:hypothetical protein